MFWGSTAGRLRNTDASSKELKDKSTLNGPRVNLYDQHMSFNGSQDFGGFLFCFFTHSAVPPADGGAVGFSLHHL